MKVDWHGFNKIDESLVIGVLVGHSSSIYLLIVRAAQTIARFVVKKSFSKLM